MTILNNANETKVVTNKELVNVRSFLHRIYPPDYYKNKEKLVKERYFKARKDSITESLFTPVDWESTDKFEDRNWRMQLQGWMFLRPLMNFFDVYPNKKVIVDYFLDIVSDWWEQYADDLDDLTTTRMPDSYAWYDMSVGSRALAIAFFINRIDFYDIDIKECDKKLLSSISHKHIHNLSVPETLSLNNHGFFQIQGLMALVMTCVVENNKKLKKYALDSMSELIFSQFDENGIHLENSPHYHFYTVDICKSVIETGWYASRPLLEERVSKAVNAGKWLVDPLKRAICVGDSVLSEQMAINFDSEDDCGKYIKSNFNSSGYAVVRSNWKAKPNGSSMLFMMGMYHTKSHKHRDCLSFDWFERGFRVICDSGKYGYKSNKYRNYFLSSRAHNSVEIEGFDIIRSKPYGSIIEGIKEIDDCVFEISGTLGYPALRHSRKLIYKPNCWVIVVDELNFKRSRAFTQWFHLDKDFALEKEDGNFLIFAGKEKRKLYIECLNDELLLGRSKGDEINMQGFISEKDYQYQPAHAVGFHGSDKYKKIHTILSLGLNDHKDAYQYIKKHFLTDSINSSLFIKNDVNNSRIPNVKHQGFDSTDDLEFIKGAATYSVKLYDVNFNFFADIKNSDKIIIMLPGATNRKKGAVDYQRYSWSSSFEQSFITFSDPTITAENDLSIGWFQNKLGSYGVGLLTILVRRIIAILGVSENDILFFGSSAGAFVSLKLANEFTVSPVVAINPQIYLYNYSKAHYEKLLDYSYRGLPHRHVLKNYKDRLSVNINYDNRFAPVFIFQNRFDDRHMNKHLMPYLKALDNQKYNEYITQPIYQNLNSLNVVFYEDKIGGHSPPSRDVTIGMIKSAISSFRITNN